MVQEDESGVYELSAYSVEAVSRMVLYMYTGDFSSNLMDNDEDIVQEFVIHAQLVALADEYGMSSLSNYAENCFLDALEARNDSYTIALGCIPQVYAIPFKAYERLRNIIIGQIRLLSDHLSPYSRVKMLRNAIEAFPQFGCDLAEAALFGTAATMCDRCRDRNSFETEIGDFCRGCNFYRLSMMH
jgi:hypothetical protein